MIRSKAIKFFSELLVILCILPLLSLSDAIGDTGIQKPSEYMVKTWEEVCRQVEECSNARIIDYCFYYQDSLDLEKEKEQLWNEMYSTGVHSFKYQFSKGMLSPKVEISDIVYNDEPFVICHSEKEIIAFINECAETNVYSFTIYLSASLAPVLFSNDHKELQETLSMTRLLKPFAYSYSEKNRRIIASDAEFYPADESSGKTVTTIADFVNVFNDHTSRMETEFAIPVTEDVYKELKTESATSHYNRDETNLFTEIICCIMKM